MINPGANTFANMPGRSGIASMGLKPVATNIAYSVGTAASPADQYVTKDKDSNTPTATIENGIMTFSHPQTHPYMGVGDKVTLADSTVVYINGKITTSEWHVLDASGSNVDSTVSTAASDVLSIDKTFNSLEDAIDGDTSGVFTLLGTHDLTSKDSNLRIMCYGMTDDIGSNDITISNLWLTSRFNRLQIIAPVDIKLQCNSPQRTVYGATGYVITGSFIVTGRITVRKNVDIEGLEIKGSSAYGIQCADSAADNWTATYCVINGPSNGISTTVGTPPVDQVVAYNIIKNFTGDGINVRYDAFIVSNTVVDGGDGIEYEATTNLDIRQNIVQNMSGIGFNDNAAGGSPLTNNISDDVIPAGGTGNQSSTTVDFIDPAQLNYRTTILSKDEVNSGGVISNPLYEFEIDAEGQKLSSTPSIGAFSQPTDVVYAVGPTATSFDSGGNFSYSEVTGTVTFTTPQTDDYLCAGCVINGTYYLSRKISTTEWEVVDNEGAWIPVAAGAAAIVDILPVFDDLYEALYDDGSSDSGIYTTLGLVSSDLTTLDKRITLNCTTGKSMRGIPAMDFITDEVRNIIVQTPNTLSGYYANTNVKRRHDGKYRTVRRTDPTNNLFIHSGGGDSADGFTINIPGFVIDGLQITSDGNGVSVVNGGDKFTIKNNIIRDCVYGIYVDSKDEGGGNAIVSNLIFSCKNDGVHLNHNFGIDTVATFGTPATDSFSVTVDSYGFDDHVYQVKVYNNTTNITTPVIRWSSGLVEIFHNNEPNMQSVLDNVEDVVGTPWGTITAIDNVSMIPDFFSLMEDAPVFVAGNEGVQHKVISVYGNTVADCDRGIFIDTISTRQATNYVYLKNNICQDNKSKDFLTSSVDPIYVFDVPYIFS
jgi:hypothetical protein